MLQQRTTTELELWGGIECTRNRVGNNFYDQLQWSGHARRVDDLERIAGLGIRTLRYPVLWESAVTPQPNVFDWTWSDQRLAQLQRLGIRPIVGFVHHGSGPSDTSLLDPFFATRLATFASAFVRRYPWVDLYTPVNEPLTTARFSALYGHWYPHARDNRSFLLALLHQCRATVLAMQEIRRVRSDAQLIQTEDLGKTHGTPTLRYQVDFENERRWLTFDLLCGRVNNHHPLHDFLASTTVKPAEIQLFCDEPCPPDLLGINYYLTSERYLDHRLARYPPHVRGGNERQAYADVEAVRARAKGPLGPKRILLEAWRRYRLPLAITEAHLGCTREEQIRWLWEVWQAAGEARTRGAEVRAVTAWSLFGAFDWDSLVTQPRGLYEPGAFDVRGGQPRPTAIAHLIRDLTNHGTSSHPALAQRGWWHRPERLSYRRSASREIELAGPPLLITGAKGTLGQAFGRICHQRGLPYRLLPRAEVDIVDAAAIQGAITRYRPWAIVNAAGYVRVDDAERDQRRCFRENVRGPVTLARACREASIPLLTFSSDLVFNGRRRSPYCESVPVAPLNVYGRSKAEAEKRVLQVYPDALVVRTSAFFGPWDDYNFVTLALRSLTLEQSFTAVDDVTISPTYVPDLVHASLDLLLDRAAGVWHLANQGEVTWADLARAAAERVGVDGSLVKPRSCRALPRAACLPRYSVLGSERQLLLPTWQHALDRFFTQRGTLSCANETG